MPKISNYTQVSASKLADKLVCDQEDSGVTSTKSVSIEQIGNAVNALQVRSDLDTQAQTIVSAINEIASYTPVYGNTASGAVATFDTSLALPLQDCTIAINAVQESGTPTPSSPKAISGFTGANVTRCGKNLFDVSKIASQTTPQGSVRSSFYIPVSNGTYTLSRTDGISAYCGVLSNNTFTDYSFNANTSRTITTQNGDVIWIWVSSGQNLSSVNNIQIEKGSTATTYEAYNGTTTPITWNDEAGTVYGGSLDVTSGKLVVTHGFIDLGTLSGWSYNSIQNFWYHAIPDVKSNTNDVLCEGYNYTNKTWGSMVNYEFGISGTSMRLHNDTVSTSAELETQLNGIHLKYLLTTPITLSITIHDVATLIGTNNIFTDTNGNTSVMYACSLKDYIDSQ